MAKTSLYPPSPTDVPEDLTAPSSEYKTQILMVLFGLLLFFALYFGVMAFCVAFSLWAISPWCPWNIPILKLFALMLILPFGTLFLYMLKNLFKFERPEKDNLIEVFEDEQPKLFAFIEQVCEETGAPMPKNVYVAPNVNAAAILNSTSIFHLFMPTAKSLMLGLGLVNAINLTEFKAVLAHEFGHFSQKSLKILIFVNTFRRILYHVVYGEDWFDRFIIGWSRLDPRIAFPAYLIRGMLWMLRWVLRSLWYVVYYFDRALSRQQEFNADLVAVSLTGSDAPVHLLYRVIFADSCFGQATQDLRVAMDHHLYTSDLFYHQLAAVKVLRRLKKDPALGEPPALPDDLDETTSVFEKDDDRVAQMWESHPSPYDREANAKAHYIRSRFDERSPWLLFENVEELRERVTYKFYRFYFKIPKDVILADPEEVQGFIDDEHSDRNYDPRYQGLYDNRNILLKNLSDLAAEGSRRTWNTAQLAQAHATLYNAEVKHRSQLYYKRFEEKLLMTSVINGWHRPKDDELEFRGETYELEDAKRLLKKVDKELERDHVWLAELDYRVFMCYFQMALHIDQEVAEELYRRYAFHLALQNIWHELQVHNLPVDGAVGFLNSLANNSSTQLRQGDFQELLATFRDVHKAMKRMLRESEQMTLPGLKNLPLGQPVRPFLLDKYLIDGLSKYEQRISERWIQSLLHQFKEMKTKVDRIHFKSLAGILALQEKIGDECVYRWSKLPAVKAVAAK